MKIAIIYTGGTIGMEAGLHGLKANGGFENKFRAALGKGGLVSDELRGALEFQFEEYPDPIDSALADFELSARIARDIARWRSKVDACLVLMGSDTLAYVAASLAFLLHDQPFPVVVCGAMHPLTVPGSDAPKNLRYAIEYLYASARGNADHVQVVFGGKLIPAVRCTKLYADRLDAMVNARSATVMDIPRESLVGVLSASERVDSQVSPDIRVVRVVPGMQARAADAALSGAPDAVILQCYGSGTAPAADSALGQAVTRVCVAGVPVFAISQSLGATIDFKVYSTSAWLERIGVVSCADLGLEAAYAKAWYLLNRGYRAQSLKQAMCKNLCGEMGAVPV